MNWAVWERIERLLVEGQVRPLVAVVPDNKDQQLHVDAASPTFWESVRRWQSLGWAIGMHGYQHLYVTREAGLLGMNRRSEFAGYRFGVSSARKEKAQERGTISVRYDKFTSNWNGCRNVARWNA